MQDNARASPKRRIGIVGAGRTRQGLGPFLARWFEAAGADVHGCSGRDLAGARRAADALGAQLGHPVASYANAAALAREVDALVVACPPDGHLAGLDAALAAGVPCLCEKPLLPWAELGAALERVAAFRERGLLLAENCQWPHALGALDALAPCARDAPLRALSMRLSPSLPGAAMVEDSLSHVLSLLQALTDLPSGASARDVRQSDPGADAERNVVTFTVVGGEHEVAVELVLRRCAEQPRPAWFTAHGVRLDRQLDADYQFSFSGPGGRVAKVQDPLAALVYGFVKLLEQSNRDRIDALAAAVALRAQLYSSILAALRGRGG